MAVAEPTNPPDARPPERAADEPVGPTDPGERHAPEEPDWPAAPDRRVVFLLDASSPRERKLLRAWVERARPEGVRDAQVECIEIPPTRRRRRRDRLDPRLEAALAIDDPLLAPLRVVWLPGHHAAGHGVRPRDLVLGDPRDPGRLRQAWILRHAPERCRIVAGEPALASELRARWQEAGGAGGSEVVGLADFVARQAALALERAERRLRGARYKVPRFVREDILARPAFRGGIEKIARQEGRDPKAVARDAEKVLREIAASHSPFVIDLVVQLIRYLYTQGYEETIHYDRQQLEQVYALTQQHPVVFLPTHKSNLDHLALQYVLHENGHPPNHTAGGINMNFFPLGLLWRRSGVFFIRRSFKDDELYKFVLHHYIDYLVEKRFTLEWYIEGGRSRSGKLLPPRFGMLAYVVDAYRRGKSDDVFLIPVSIAYDQIQDVGGYVAEQKGGAKERESFGWFLKVLRTLRQPYGAIHFRFGEPLSLRKTLGPPEPGAEAGDDVTLSVQKLAFEVCTRINRVTPITPSSLASMALLGRGDRALSLEQVRGVMRNRLEYARGRELPMTQELDIDSDEALRRTLEALTRNRVLTKYEDGPEPVWSVARGQHLTAAYYRNTVLHFFVTPSIAELALLRAAEPDVEDRLEEFWAEAMRLRDLLKFEFFFSEKEEFRTELRRELALHDGEWESRVNEGSAQTVGVLYRFQTLSAHRTLRPFLEAYRVVGDELEGAPADGPLDEPSFLRACLNRGRQYELQRRIQSPESVSKLLFQTALKLAANRGLLTGGPRAHERAGRTDESPSGEQDVAESRRAFADEIRGVVRRVDGIDALAASRRAGILN